MTSKIFQEHLKTKHPKMKNQKVILYTETLAKLYKKVFPDDVEMDFNKFHNIQPFLSHLSRTSNETRRECLTALVSFTDENEYKTILLYEVLVHLGLVDNPK